MSEEADGNTQEPTSTTTSVRQSLHSTSISITGLFIIAAVAALYWLKPVLLPLVLAALLAAAVRPIVLWLSKFGVPRTVSAALVLVVMLAVAILAVWRFSTPISEWTTRIPVQLEHAERELRELRKPVEEMAEVTEKVDDIAKGSADDYTPVVQIDENNLSDALIQGAQVGVAHLTLTLVLLFFVIGYGHRIAQKFSRETRESLLDEIFQSVSSYLFTITLINVGLGVCIGVVMWVLGMPNPVLLGVLGCFLNYLPWIGAAAGIGITTFVSLLTFDELTQTVLPPIAYFVLTVFEANFVTPIILGHRFPINPLILFVWILFWGLLWGVLGVLLAVPLLMVVRLTLAHFDRTEFLGDLIGDLPREYVRRHH